LYYDLRNNEKRLEILEIRKTDYLFSSEDLLKVLDVTPSVKTKISMIAYIGPRLIDPKTKSDYLIASFRFSEEKRIVEAILKARVQTLNASVFRAISKGNRSLMAGGRGGGKGGRNFGRDSSSEIQQSVLLVSNDVSIGLDSS
jgi:hypothetical protein